MSGAKQHHIPRSVQRGFLFDAKAERTYVFRRDGFTAPAAIKDVAAQRYFYSRPSSDGSKTLDDIITDYEDRLGRLLICLRAMAVDSLVDTEVAAEVIAHLTPRSAHVRRSFGKSMDQLLTATVEAFYEEDTAERMLGLAEPEPNETWRECVARLFESDPQIDQLLRSLPIPKSLLERIVFMAMKEYFSGGFDPRNLGIAEVLTAIQDRLNNVIREGHNKALSLAIVADAHKDLLRALVWTIRAAPPEGAVLPDCVALGLNEERVFLPYMMARSESLVAVVMPITSKKLLVGTRLGQEIPDLTNFNHDAAACSDELFIAASQCLIFTELGKNIGQRWEGAIDTVVKNAIKSIFDDKDRTEQTAGESAPISPIGFYLNFVGCGTEEQVAPISETTKRIVAHVSQVFDLERLDGITFSFDQATALNQLVRGFDVEKTVEWMPDHIARGVAAALVVREGVVKVHVVIHADYARALVGGDETRTTGALHLLVAGLVQACTVKRIDVALPGFLLEPVPMSDHHGVLHVALRKALRAYRYARDSAHFDGGELIDREFLMYFTSTFAHGSGLIAQAKRDHATTPDFSKLFRSVHEAVSDILISTARLIGHRRSIHGMEELVAEDELEEESVIRPLRNWIEVFSKDLQRFWEKDAWTRNDFYALNIHAERLLWANGIVLWPEPNGQGTIIMAGPPDHSQ